MIQRFYRNDLKVCGFNSAQEQSYSNNRQLDSSTTYIASGLRRKQQCGVHFSYEEHQKKTVIVAADDRL
jgi:hypothetical protein